MTTSNSKYTSTKIACYAGYFVQAIINNLASLFYVIFQDEFGLNYSQISWLILINFVSQIFIDFASVKVIEKVGYRISIVFAHVFACAGLILLGILPRAFNNHFIGLVIPIIIYAIGSGLIEVLISPISRAYLSAINPEKWLFYIPSIAGDRLRLYLLQHFQSNCSARKTGYTCLCSGRLYRFSIYLPL